MKQLGAIVLSFEESGDLSGIVPWKSENPLQLHAAIRRKLVPLTGFIFLSTCNRVEIIYTIKSPEYHDALFEAVMDIMPALDGSVAPSHYRGRKALKHLLRLAAGLESMVLGETEIRSQIKDAFEDARTANLLDKRLRILFQHVFQESRRIRSEIPMANLPLSVATLATKKVIQAPGFVDRADATMEQDRKAIVIIGSGPMSKQAAIYLSDMNNRLVLVNRTLSKIEKQAEELNAEMATFDRFINEPDTIGPIAAIVTATSRDDAFITPEFLKKIKGRTVDGYLNPLILVDMALPPDVDPSCSNLSGVTLVSMETLRQELDVNRMKRLQAAELAEELLEDSGFRIEANLVAALSGNIIKEYQKDVRDKSREKLENLLDDRLSHLSKKDRNLIYTWAIQAHKEMNRIHRKGLETVIRNYYADQTHEFSI